jgi:hypothetical protein
MITLAVASALVRSPSTATASRSSSATFGGRDQRIYMADERDHDGPMDRSSWWTS